MRRKDPSRHRRNRHWGIKRDANQTYVISKKAEAILSTVLADILEESLEDARNLAVTAGKSSVTQEDMERSLRNLCLRLSTVPAYNLRIPGPNPWTDDEDEDSKGSVASSKFVSGGSQRRCGSSSRCHGDCSRKIVTIYRNLRFFR
ncbi:unnamed protein product [Xylocopa violacea]|uniref:Histone H2A/H2B/H3 domain-containing protein n=1 Tax=Xylocopa violacea TaxID=135666 RepID=A0ABP1P9X8_XYLVO